MGRDCTQESGQCSECRGYCVSKPGWFLPGEAEKVADHLGLNLVDLFKSKWRVRCDGTVGGVTREQHRGSTTSRWFGASFDSMPGCL